MVAPVSEFLRVDTTLRADRNVVAVDENFRRVQATLEELRITLNGLISEVNALGAQVPGFSGQVPASDVIVNRGAFDGLLSAFVGSSAQQLFDFLDDLRLEQVGQASLSNLSVVGVGTRVADLQATFENITQQAQLTIARADLIETLTLKCNGVVIETLSGPINGTTFKAFTINSAEFSSVSGVNATRFDFVAEGELSGGGVIISNTYSVTEDAPAQHESVYYGVMDDPAQFATFDYTSGASMDLGANGVGTAAFSTPAATLNQHIYLATPSNVDVVRFTNRGIGADEFSAFTLRGTVQIASLPNPTHNVYTLGPLVAGATFNYEVETEAQ